VPEWSKGHEEIAKLRTMWLSAFVGSKLSLKESFIKERENPIPCK